MSARIVPARRRLPNRRPHLAINFESDGVRYVVGIGTYENGAIAEIFLNTVRRYGTTASVAAGDAAVAASLALQHGCPIDTLRHAVIRNPDGSALGVLGAALDLIAERQP